REAALGAERQAVERREARGLVDAAPELVLRLERRSLRRHQPEHRDLAFAEESQWIEGARARRVVLEEEAVDVHRAEHELGDRVVAALRDPRALVVAT